MMNTNQNMPTVLVTDAGRGSAVTIIRSLGRKGYRVIAADTSALSPGMRSRYTACAVRYPDPKQAPDACVDVLLHAARTHRVDLLIPVTDEVILPLSDARDRFEGICQIAMAAPAALDVVTDKRKTFQLAECVDVPVPCTHLVGTREEATAVAPALGWPIVLKPQISRLYHEGDKIETLEVSYAEDQEQLNAQMARLEGRCEVLLQEFCRGTGQGVELLLHEGRPLAAFQHRRLREVPITGGASAFRESVPLNPMLYEYSVRLLASLEWTGLAMVEFKVGDGRATLMEINGRVWGSLPLAVLSGMDFPARLADLYLSGPPADSPTLPDSRYAVGVRARNLELDLMWVGSVMLGRQRYPSVPIPSRRAAAAALVGLLNPAYKFDILSLDDPLPGLVECVKIAAKVGRKARKII